MPAELPAGLRPRPALIAHRGVSARRPENTLAAFRLAAREGITAVELDVRRCADASVVFHDADLQRCFGLATALSDCSRTDLDAIGHRHTRPIPSLPAVYEALPPWVAVNVEVKDPDTFPDVVALAATERARTLVSSFDHAVLARIASTGKQIALAPLYSEPPDPQDLERTILRLDAAAVHCAARALTADLVATATAHGLPVFCYTVNDTGTLRQVLAAGAAGVFSDDPRALMAAN